MEMKKPAIKSIPYEEFKDNETLEKLLNELNKERTNVIVGKLDDIINWGRSNSLWSLTFATSCCGIEFMAVGAARYDFARFGFEVTRNSPRQADLIMVAGTITHKMAPVLKRLYDQMAEPKYVVAVGGCAISGGPFKGSYHVLNGVDKILPVDVYIPGCPPRPEAMLYGMMQLQRKVKIENFFGDKNRKHNSNDIPNEPIIVTNVPITPNENSEEQLFRSVGTHAQKHSQLPVQYIRLPRKLHGQDCRVLQRFHRLSDDQLSCLGGKLPVDLLQVVAGTVQPQLVIFRIAAAGLGTGSAAEVAAHVGHLGRQRCHRAHQHQPVLPKAYRQSKQS